MVISDLTYLETVSEESSLHGGLFNFSSSQFNSGILIQMATASAGNNSKFAIGNVALAINIGIPIQINL